MRLLNTVERAQHNAVGTVGIVQKAHLIQPPGFPPHPGDPRKQFGETGADQTTL